MESAIKQIARRIDRRTERRRLTRQDDRERSSEFTGGRVRPHKGSEALLIRELIGMPRMPTTMEQGLGYPPPKGGGCTALASPVVTEGQAELTSRSRGCSARYRGSSRLRSSLSLSDDFDPIAWFLFTHELFRAKIGRFLGIF